MALLGAHRLRAIDQPARPDARATRRNAIEKTKPLGAPAAPRAYKHRPKAAVPEAPQRDDDLIFDAVVAEPDARRLCVPLNLAQRHQGRHANQGQIIDRAFHKAEN
jgi:hypothetical protein